jgi:hypothetical protein
MQDVTLRHSAATIKETPRDDRGVSDVVGGRRIDF